MNLNKNNLYKKVLILFFLIIIFFLFNNALNYNSYWGYDGGAHLDYITTLIDEHRLPIFSENYLAWHEPLYYFIFALFGIIYKFISGSSNNAEMFKFLQVLSSFFNVFFLYIFYRTLAVLTGNKKVQISSLVSVAFLTPLILINNYLTNELFLYWLIVLAFYFIVKFDKIGWNYRRIFFLALIASLALLSKLSALIFIATFVFWFIYKAFYEKNKNYWPYVGLFLSIVFILNLPWQIYRSKNLGGVFTVNNYEFLAKENLAQNKKIPIKFWFNFDREILKNPFWASGQDSFWSIILAQTFVDYDNIGGNVDKNNLEKQVLTSNNRYLSYTKFKYSQLALYNGLVIVFIILIALIYQIIKFIKNRIKPDINLLFLMYVIFSFGALIFNFLANPFLARGTLKIIFIVSAWPWLFFLVYKNINDVLEKYKLKYLWPIIFLIIAVYSFLSLIFNLVIKY